MAEEIKLDMIKQEKVDDSEIVPPQIDYPMSKPVSGKDDGDPSSENDNGILENVSSSFENKLAYRSLKRKVKSLLYEQECFYEELRRLQRKLLRINRDKSFLLDRLLQYELPEFSSSDEEETASSSADEVDRSYFRSDCGPTLPSKQPKKAVGAAGKGGSGKADLQSKQPPKPKKSMENVERVRCKEIENGKRCPKMVSKRVKSGLCLVHRQPPSTPETDKKASSSTPQDRRGPPLQRPTPPKPSRLGPSTLSPMISGGFINDDLQVSDGRDMQQDMFHIADSINNSGPADSPASPDFHSNIYDGDDDLVIDLPE